MRAGSSSCRSTSTAWCSGFHRIPGHSKSCSRSPCPELWNEEDSNYCFAFLAKLPGTVDLLISVVQGNRERDGAALAVEALLVPHRGLAGNPLQLKHFSLATLARRLGARVGQDGRGVHVLARPVRVGRVLVQPAVTLAGAAVRGAAKLAGVAALETASQLAQFWI